MSGDLLGDLLREFYSRYGISGEGPEADLNVSELIAGLSDSTPNLLESDIDLLRRMIADDKLSHVIRECDGLLEEIANNAGDTTLLEEINKRFDDMALDPNAVFHGILWYTQAVQADPRQCEEAAHRSPLRTAVDSGASPIALGEQVTGATILRLYVALVYLRGDWIRQGIGRATLDSAPSLLRYARLLSNEVIRHLRNSLAHRSHYSDMRGSAYQGPRFRGHFDSRHAKQDLYLDFPLTLLNLHGLRSSGRDHAPEDGG